MKVKKWLLGLVTFAAMAVLCVVCEGAETYGDFEYYALDDGTVYISNYNGSAKTVDIPAKIDGMSVVCIGQQAFEECTSLTSITIPDSVTEIEFSAFESCTNLKSIVIPDSVTNIGSDAFNNTALLKNQATSEKYVGKWVVDCDDAKSVTIKESTVGIGDRAFDGCTSLKSITMPDSVTEIGWSAFRNCASLKSITIPDSVTEISEEAFRGCTSLTSITIPDSVTSIAQQAFEECTSLTSITIPDGVTEIGEEAFSGCTSLINITIPDSVTEIGKFAFDFCESLTNITIPNVVTSIDAAFRGCTSLTNITIPDGVTSIDEAFYGCTSLTSITIPDSVASIGGWTFEGCTSLTSITIPNSVTNIGGWAFNGCTSLKSITIPDSVTDIGDGAFQGCKSLTSIAIPDNVTYIGNWAFADCSSMTEIKVASENSNYVSLNGVLYNKDKTTIIYYPIGKTDKNYKIPDSVTNIGESAFSDCTSLTSISIPNGVANIGGSAFSGCTNLTSITIPNSATEIGWGAFKNCESLTSVAIPDGVTSIGDVAFGYYYDKYDDCIKKIDGFKIYCNSGTMGEQYAKNNYFNYELLDKPTLAKVTGTKLTGRAADALRINWTKNANADGYIVEIYKDGKWARAAKITSNATTTYRASGLKASTVYKFRVKAYKMYGSTAAYSDYSAELAARTNPSVVKGAKLTGRAADALRINWSKNAYADGYIVEMYQGNKWVRVAKITNNNTTTFRKAGLKAGTAYKFRVRAYKISGKTAVYGNYSATVSARTNPSVVKGAKLTGRAADALRINWTKNTTADGYIVEMYKGGKWVRAAKITKNSTTTYRASGLKASTVYKFRVRAYKMSGKTALYGNYSATVTARTNPSAVKGVKIVGKAKDALRVNWTKNTSAQGYIVEMYKGGKWVRVAKITNGNTTTYRKAGLAKNTTYKFRVKAYYMSGKTALYGGYGSVSGKTAAK